MHDLLQLKMLPPFFNKTDAEIEAALASVDKVAIAAGVESDYAKLSIEVWDKKTPINGKDADYVLERWKKIGFWDGESDIVLAKNGNAIIQMWGCGQDHQAELDAQKLRDADIAEIMAAAEAIRAEAVKADLAK